MYKEYFSMLFLTATILICKSIKAQDLTENNLFATPTTYNGIPNSNLQTRFSGYFQTMQSLPFPDASTSLRNQPGYNYITPASTYAGYSTSKHTTHTAPLAISIHPDDYTKFDKIEETYFLPRSKSLSTHTPIKPQPNFYIPRANAHRNTVRVQSIDTKLANENTNPAQHEDVKTTTETIQYQPETNFRIQPQVAQQNWRPLPTQNRDFENPLNPFIKQTPLSSGLTYQSAPASTDFYQFKQAVSSNPTVNLTSFRPYSLNQDPPSTVDCQKQNTNFETVLRSTNPSESQNELPVTLLPHQKIPPAEAPSNFPTSSSLNTVNHRRLSIIKSLLAEYLALTQSYTPSASQRAQVNLNNDAFAGNSVDNRFSAEAQAFQLSAYSPTRLPSPAVNKFIDADQYQRQQYYQTSPTIAAIRQPHSVYGAPFVDSLNSVSHQSNGEIS